MTRKTYISIPVPVALLGGAHIPAECCELHPHVTLHHLGVTTSAVEAQVHELVRNACAGQGPIRAELTGLGTFMHAHLPKVQGKFAQTPAVLVNSRPISKLWGRLDYFLAGIGIRISEKYGFIPHVTLKTLQSDAGNAYWMAGFHPRSIVLHEVHVVTKDKTKQYEHRERIVLEAGPSTVAFRATPGETVDVEPPSGVRTGRLVGQPIEWKLATPDEVAESVAAAVHNRLDTSDVE